MPLPALLAIQANLHANIHPTSMEKIEFLQDKVSLNYTSEYEIKEKFNLNNDILIIINK